MKKYSNLLKYKYDYIVFPILLRTMKETRARVDFNNARFVFLKNHEFDFIEKIIEICISSRKSHSATEDYLTNISYWPKDLYLNLPMRTFQLLFFSRIINAFVDAGIDKKLSINSAQNRNLYSNVRDYIDRFPFNFNEELYTNEILTALDNLHCLDKNGTYTTNFLDLKRRFLYKIGIRDSLEVLIQNYEIEFVQPFQIGL